MPEIIKVDDPDIDTKTEELLNIKEPYEGYFSFHKLISGTFIKVLYFLGMLALIGAGGVFIYNGIKAYSGGTILILYGAGLITVGNLVWRIFCESWIVLFNIYEVLKDILYETKPRRWERKN